MYFFNDELLIRVVTVGGVSQSVFDHVGKALGDYFEQHPEILADMFIFDPNKMGVVRGDKGMILRQSPPEDATNGHAQA